MSSRDSASGSSTFHGGGKYIGNSDPVGAGTGGGGLAQLMASLVSGAPQTHGLIAPPIPTARPQQAPQAGPVPPKPTARPAAIPPQQPGGYPQMNSPNLGPFPAPAYRPGAAPQPEITSIPGMEEAPAPGPGAPLIIPGMPEYPAPPGGGPGQGLVAPYDPNTSPFFRYMMDNFRIGGPR